MKRKKLPIKDAARTYGLVAITVDDATLSSFGSARNVWEGLYTWLVAKHGAKDDRLHARVRIGDQLAVIRGLLWDK